MSRLTPWFPAGKGVKPVRNGVYIASVGRNTFYRYWNGRWWSRGSYSLEEMQAKGWTRHRFGTNKHQAQISWRVERDPASDGRLVKDGEGVVAYVFADDNGVEARLIASAPEMKAALKELCDRLGPRWFLQEGWADPLAVLAKVDPK